MTNNDVTKTYINEVRQSRKKESPPEAITKRVGDFVVTWPGGQYVTISTPDLLAGRGGEDPDDLNKKEVKQLITILTQFHKKMS